MYWTELLSKISIITGIIGAAIVGVCIIGFLIFVLISYIVIAIKNRREGSDTKLWETLKSKFKRKKKQC